MRASEYIDKIKAERNRLREANAILLEALTEIANYDGFGDGAEDFAHCHLLADAAIRKAKELYGKYAWLNPVPEQLPC